MIKETEVVMKCMEEEGITQTELARRMGIDRRLLNQMLLRGKSIKTEKYQEMLECIGYTTKIEKANAIRVNPSLANEISESGKPDGNFWCDKNGVFVGIHNEGGYTETKYFGTRRQLEEAWL